MGERVITKPVAEVKAQHRFWSTLVDSATLADAGKTQTLADDDAGTTPVPEAGAPDASGSGTGPDGLPPHGPNLLLNGNFELGCAGFNGSNTALTESSIARNGTSACQLCFSFNGGTQFAQDVQNLNVTVGQRYYTEVWIHAPAAGTSTATMPGSLYLSLRGPNSNNDAPAATGGIPSATEWQRTNTLLTTTQSGSTMSFVMRFDNNVPDTCVVVDDAAIYLLD